MYNSFKFENSALGTQGVDLLLRVGNTENKIDMLPHSG